MTCERCGKAQATTHQEYRDSGDQPYWPNRVTNRCDRCAQDLREYVALTGISMAIVMDNPLAPKVRVRVADGEAEGLDTDGGRWQVICDTHGSILSVESRTQARDDARAARRLGACEWCEDCMEGRRA